jgi:release factor glutamine methyltransferase
MSTILQNNTIEDLLFYGKNILSECGIRESKIDAELLLAYVLNCNRIKLYTHSEEYINSVKEKKYRNLILRRAKGIPLNYLIYSKEFMGLEFKVFPGVFIPRPETEHVVEETINIITNLEPQLYNNLTILDLCTGTGNIAISLSYFLKQKNINPKIYATDISELSIKTAKFNSKRYMLNNITFFQGDLFIPVDNLKLKNKINIIVSNPPYIPSDEISKLQKEILYEPRIALDGGKTGLEYFYRIASIGKNYISDKGFIVVEIGYNQKEEVLDIFRIEGYKIINIIKDYSEIDRVIVAQWIK